VRDRTDLWYTASHKSARVTVFPVHRQPPNQQSSRLKINDMCWITLGQQGVKSLIRKQAPPCGPVRMGEFIAQAGCAGVLRLLRGCCGAGLAYFIAIVPYDRVTAPPYQRSSVATRMNQPPIASSRIRCPFLMRPWRGDGQSARNRCPPMVLQGLPRWITTFRARDAEASRRKRRYALVGLMRHETSRCPGGVKPLSTKQSRDQVGDHRDRVLDSRGPPCRRWPTVTGRARAAGRHRAVTCSGRSETQGAKPGCRILDECKQSCAYMNHRAGAVAEKTTRCRGALQSRMREKKVRRRSPARALKRAGLSKPATSRSA